MLAQTTRFASAHGSRVSARPSGRCSGRGRRAPAGISPARRAPRGSPSGSMKRTSSWTVRSSETSSAPRSRKKLDQALDQLLGGAGAGGDADRLDSLEPLLLDLGVVVDQVGGGAVLAGDLDQAVGVRGVGRADHEHQVALAGELLDRDLAVGGRVTDVVGLGADDRRELGAQGGDDLGRLVDRERRLGDEGDPLGVGDLERVDLLGGLRPGRCCPGASPVVPSTSSWPSWPIITIV